MKAWVIYTLSILAALVIIAAVIYGLRLFTNISTPITVHQVQPGSFIWRCRFLLAYRNDIKNKSGSLDARQELARRFNANKFWFQKHIEIPKKMNNEQSK